MELLKNQHGETHNAVATLADSRWIEEVEVNEKGFREWDEWESDEGTLIRGVTEERNEESLYSQDAMSWGIPRESGSYSTYVVCESIDIDIDIEACDRVTLLAKKYASESVRLDKEDNARLEMLNYTMDLKYPRYTAQDFKTLDEAEELLKEIKKLRGE